MLLIVAIFGLISGGISVLMMLLTMPFIERIGFDVAEILGYTTLICSFLLVFFGIRRYREQSGGTLTFGRGFTVGILITLISSLCYVAAWQVVRRQLVPDFVDKYQTHLLDKAKAEGATPAQLDEKAREFAQFKEWYSNPLVNVALTFLEPFPVGLAVTLISAAVLRRKESAPGRAPARA